jgi:SH3-like domain-containing protein
MRQSPQCSGAAGCLVFWAERFERSDMRRLFLSYEACAGIGLGAPGNSPKLRGCTKSLAAAALALTWAVLSGCTAKTEPPAVEQAYVARSSVALLEDLHPASPIVAELEMGERVQILGRRRSFVRIRSDDGREGWAKSTELIVPEVRDLVIQVREQTLADPPQGEVRALQTLNVHLEPYRWSPTIYQLSADEGAELLRHKTVDRVPEKPEEGKTPPPVTEQDDWYLLRLATGRAGWVLASGVYSAIPEEVAQYAERRRIVSYFALDDGAEAGEDSNRTWLWTQVSEDNQPYDFDLLRVFLWSRQRQAYQTVKIERGLRGYLPVLVQQRVEAERSAGPGFSVVVENKRGELVQRTYALLRNRVTLVSEQPAPPRPAPIRFVSPEAPPPSPTFMDRLLSWWKGQS